MRRRLLYHTSTVQPKEQIWNDPVVTLSYNPDIASCDGDTMYPIVEWYQTYYYSDDTSQVFTGMSGTSATGYNYTGSLSINTGTGVVTVSSTTKDSEQTLGTVTAYVTSNGKTGYSDPYTIKQEAYSTAGLSMDVVLFNKSDRHRYFVSKDAWNTNDYPADTYEPLGIVVIPASHGRYGNYNTIGVISMMDASVGSPKDGQYGSSTSKLAYGNYSSNEDDNNYSEIRTFSQAGIPYNVDGTTISSNYYGVVNDNSQNVYFPSDAYSVLANSLDPGTYYSVSTMTYGAPSPYENGNASSLYGNSNSDKYCFGIFDGEVRSFDYMSRLYKTGMYEDWLNDNEIPQANPNISNDSEWVKVLPAMEACWRYSPMGNNEGGWYLPSTGEAGYIIARKQAINDTISALQEAYHKNDSTTYATVASSYLTSTEFSESNNNRRAYAILIGESAHAIINYAYSSVRPFKSIYGVTSSSTKVDLGVEPVPQKLSRYIDVDASNEGIDTTISRWCVMREGTSAGSPYPDGRIVSGKVYGVLVNGQNDFTVLKTDVELFSISNLEADYNNDEVEEVGKNYGYYNSDVESGWYLIQKIVCTDSNGNEKTIDNLNGVSVGSTLTKSNWNGYASVCYKYPYMTGVYFDDYEEWAYNDDLYAFRVGYWNYKTVIYLHGTKHYDDDIVVPGVYKDPDPGHFVFPSFKYGNNLTWNSEDETNYVTKLSYGGKIFVDTGSTSSSMSFLRIGFNNNKQNDTYITVNRSNASHNPYMQIGLNIKLYNNETDTTPINILSSYNDIYTGNYSYGEMFTGGQSYYDFNLSNYAPCYAEVELVIKSVYLENGDTIELNGGADAYVLAAHYV